MVRVISMHQIENLEHRIHLIATAMEHMLVFELNGIPVNGIKMNYVVTRNANIRMDVIRTFPVAM